MSKNSVLPSFRIDQKLHEIVKHAAIENNMSMPVYLRHVLAVFHTPEHEKPEPMPFNPHEREQVQIVNIH